MCWVSTAKEIMDLLEREGVKVTKLVPQGPRLAMAITEDEDEAPPSHGNVVLGAMTTSWARLILLEEMERYLPRPGESIHAFRLLYTDTLG